MSVYLLDDDDPRFPPARLASPDGDGILAVGGDYSVPRLLEAYAGGIFPWSTFRGRITWHSPDPRFVLLPENFKIPRSLQRVLKKHPFQITVDRAFDRVIAACASVPRPEGGTWINDRLRAGYTDLHRAGFAHSVEAWKPMRPSVRSQPSRRFSSRPAARWSTARRIRTTWSASARP